MVGSPGTEKSPQNIQDSFLNNARKEKSLVTIYLVSGVRLTGRIKSFDKYSLILESNSQEHLVFKHAISTVVTGRPVHAGSSPPPVQAAAAHSPALARSESAVESPREGAED